MIYKMKKLAIAIAAASLGLALTGPAQSGAHWPSAHQVDQIKGPLSLQVQSQGAGEVRRGSPVNQNKADVEGARDTQSAEAGMSDNVPQKHGGNGADDKAAKETTSSSQDNSTPATDQDASSAEKANQEPVNLSESDTGQTEGSQNTPQSAVNNRSPQEDQQEPVRFFDENPGIGQVLSEKEYLKKVDPEFNPGQKYLVVEKNAERSDQESLLAAARRAREFNRYEAALRFYNQLKKMNPDDKIINLERAITLHKLNRYGAAMKAYDEVLDVDPANLEARVNMLALVRNKYPSVALEKMRTLYEDNPENARLAAQIGIMYAEIGETEQARQYLGSAISLEPGNPNHYFNLAILEDKTGQALKALDLYQKALELDVVHKRYDKIPREQIYDRLSILRQRI